MADGAACPCFTSCIAMCASCRLFVARPMGLSVVLSVMVLICVLSPMMFLCVFSRMVLIFNLSFLVLSFVQGWLQQIFVLRPQFLMLS